MAVKKLNVFDTVLAIAEAEVGYLEKSVIAYKKNPDIIYEKTAGAGYDNYTKYGKEMHDIYPSVMDFPAPYCDAFVDWCFYKAYGVTTAKSLIGGNFDDYTVASASMYDKKKALHTNPKVGDQVFFTKNGNIKGCYHTGLIYKVDKEYFYTIEGNTSSSAGVVANGGCVTKKKYSIAVYKGKTLFGRPKYDAGTASKETSKSDKEKTKTKAPAAAKPTITFGTTGAQALALQKDLNYLGFKGANGKKLTEDGEIGDNSIYALKSFQKKYELFVDGIYGSKSYAKMIDILKNL